MNTKEKYDSIITTIENMVHDYDYEEDKRFSDDEIIKESFEAGNAGYMTDKIRNGMFSFMTNHTPKNYIAERRMMLVYQRMITDESFSQSEAYWLSGVDSQKGYIDKFKKVFAITPDVAKRQRDPKLLLPPKTWDLISDNFVQQMCEVSFNNPTEKRFGLELDKYSNAILATNLMEYYGLNQKEADIAFDIAENNSLDFESVFEYVYGYVWQYIDPLPDDKYTVGAEFGYSLKEKVEFSKYPHPEEGKRDERLEKDLTDRAVINLYFKCGLGFSDIRTAFFLRDTGKIKYSLVHIEEGQIKLHLQNYKNQQEAEKWQMISDMQYGGGYYSEQYCFHHEDEQCFEYYESLDDDDPDRVEYEMNRCVPSDNEIYRWEESREYGNYEEEAEYDLDDPTDFEKLCKEVEAGHARYRGNKDRMMPIGKYNLDVETEVRAEKEKHKDFLDEFPEKRSWSLEDLPY